MKQEDVGSLRREEIVLGPQNVYHTLERLFIAVIKLPDDVFLSFPLLLRVLLSSSKSRMTLKRRLNLWFHWKLSRMACCHSCIDVTRQGWGVLWYGTIRFIDSIYCLGSVTVLNIATVKWSPYLNRAVLGCKRRLCRIRPVLPRVDGPRMYGAMF